MKEILIACGQVELLKDIIANLPQGQIKPIATKRGANTAAKLAARNLPLAIIHEHLEDHAAGQLLQELKQLPNPPKVLWLSAQTPPKQGLFDRAMRYPIPGPVFRNAVSAMLPKEEDPQDLERWRTFYRELKTLSTKQAEQNYYQILGVPNQAPHHMLVKAFDVLSMRYHPDRYNQYRHERWGEAVFQEANAIYKLITHAYSVLTDRKLNAAYQQALKSGQLRLDPEEANKRDQGPKSIVDAATTQGARKFLKLAQSDLARQQYSGALQNLKFALSMEPDNQTIIDKIKEIEAMFG